MGIRVSTVPYGTIIIIEHAKRHETMAVVEIRRNRLPFIPSDRKSRIFSGSEDVECVFQLTKRKFTAILTILWFRSKFDTARNSFCHISCHCQLQGKVENDTRIIALRHFYIFVAIFARLLLLYVFPCFITEL